MFSCLLWVVRRRLLGSRAMLLRLYNDDTPLQRAPGSSNEPDSSVADGEGSSTISKGESGAADAGTLNEAALV